VRRIHGGGAVRRRAPGVSAETASLMDFKTADVEGVRVSYREAGDPSKTTIVLLQRVHRPACVRAGHPAHVRYRRSHPTAIRDGSPRADRRSGISERDHFTGRLEPRAPEGL